jgi:hypothetical protein
MKTEDKGFEEWWAANKLRMLNENQEYRDAVATYGMKSGSDWLLFGIPVATGIVCIQGIPIRNELLRFLLLSTAVRNCYLKVPRGHTPRPISGSTP